MAKFKVGDVLRCINQSDMDDMERALYAHELDGSEVVVTSLSGCGNYVRFGGRTSGWGVCHFELVHPARTDRVKPCITSEADPSGLAANAPGAKLDSGKPLVSEILEQFPRALLGVCEVGTFGARKYSMGGWQHVLHGIKRYANAAGRHYLYRAQGEEFDRESNLEHLKHEVWNKLAELELTLREKEKQCKSA